MTWHKPKSETFDCDRAAVSGGWPVLVTAPPSEKPLLGGSFGGMTFLPDGSHIWDGTDPLTATLGLRASQ